MIVKEYPLLSETYQKIEAAAGARPVNAGVNLENRLVLWVLEDHEEKSKEEIGVFALSTGEGFMDVDASFLSTVKWSPSSRNHFLVHVFIETE